MATKARQAAYLNKNEAPLNSFRWVHWMLPLTLFCATVFYAEEYLANPTTLPVNTIRVQGVFENVDELMLHRSIAAVVSGGYFNVDVERVREVVEQLEWVREASVRRIWPDALSVSIVEQKPVAISKDAGLINANGDVFKPENKVSSTSLPIFEGSNHSYKLMLSKYYEMNILLGAIDKKVIYLNFDARHAIELKLDNGLKVVLGRGDMVQRLERLIRIYPKILAKRINDIDVIDLRYTNGMAISWKNEANNIKGMLGDTKHV